MRQTIMILLGIFLLGFKSYSQEGKQIEWSFSAKKTTKDTAILLLNAKLEPGWHLYSQQVKDGGPVRTSFEFDSNRNFITIGETEEPKSIGKFEPNFMMEVNYFEKSVVFKQKIALKKGHKLVRVKGNVQYMICNDSQCIPPVTKMFNIYVD